MKVGDLVIFYSASEANAHWDGRCALVTRVPPSPRSGAEVMFVDDDGNTDLQWFSRDRLQVINKTEKMDDLK